MSDWCAALKTYRESLQDALVPHTSKVKLNTCPSSASLMLGWFFSLISGLLVINLLSLFLLLLAMNVTMLCVTVSFTHAFFFILCPLEQLSIFIKSKTYKQAPPVFLAVRGPTQQGLYTARRGRREISRHSICFSAQVCCRYIQSPFTKYLFSFPQLAFF